MPCGDPCIDRDRREFIQGIASAAALLCLGARDAFSAAPATRPRPAAPAWEYQYRTVSARHVREIQDWMRKLEREKRISPNRTFRQYIGGFRFGPPPELPRARSLVVLSRRERLCSVTFHSNGKGCDVLIPTGYVDPGIPANDVRDRVMREVLGGRGSPPVRAALPLKTLAVRSGLAEYGKNNITFVDGYGSFHALHAYFTDQELPDRWGPLRLLRLCKGCSICERACPMQCIRENNFVINVGRCITLFNELEGVFPSWIPASAHHTLVGCLKCQYTCPANRQALGQVEKLADVDEAETRLLVEGRRNEKLEKSIAAKLKRIPLSTPHLSRNAGAALANGGRV